MDLCFFDVLANELLQHIVGFLDAPSLSSFVSTSHQYKEFEFPMQERWKILYAKKWCVDPLELDCYDKDWKYEFKARYLREKDLNKHIDEIISSSTTDTILMGTEDDQVIVSTDQFEQLVVTFGAAYDPWYISMHAQNVEDVNRAIPIAQNLYERGSLSDIKREVDALRPEILFSAVRRFSLSPAKHTELEYLLDNYLFSDLVTNAELPIGVLSWIKDLILTERLYRTATRVLEKLVVSNAPKYQKSFWYKMEIVPKLLDLIQKEKDSNTKFEMLHVLVRYSPDDSDPNFVDEQFVRNIMLDLKTGMKQQDSRALSQFKYLLNSFLSRDLDLCCQLGLVDLFVDFSAPKKPRLFRQQIAAVYKICLIEGLRLHLGSNTNLLDYQVQFCVQQYKQDKPVNEDLEYCLLILAELVYHSNDAFFYVFKNHLDNLLALAPLPQIDAVSELYLNLVKNVAIRSIAHNCSAVMNEKLMQYYDVFSAYPLRVNTVRFWQAFILIDNLTTKQAAQVATRFLTAFESDVKTMARDLKACIVAAITNMIIRHNDAFAGLDLTRSLAVLIDELLIDGRNSKKFDPTLHFSDHYPYALKLLSSYAHFPHLSKLMIKNSKLLEKLYTLADDPNEPPETLYLLAFLFSCIVIAHPHWRPERPLKCIQKYATEVPISVQFVFMFPTITPFKYLFTKTNPPEVILFAAWTLGRVAHSANLHTRAKLDDKWLAKNIEVEIEDGIVTWLDNFPHPKMASVMNQFHKLFEEKK